MRWTRERRRYLRGGVSPCRIELRLDEKDAVRQVGSTKIRISKIGAKQVRESQIGPAQVRANEVRTPQAGAAQIGPSESRTH